MLVLLHGGPGAVDRHRLVQDGGRVVIQVQHLGAHALDEHGRIKMKAVEDQLGFVAEMAQAGGGILALSGGVAQSGVGHSGDNGVRIRIPVAGDIDLFHGFLLLRSFLLQMLL